MRGYFGVGIEGTKTGSNIGTLWRSAYILGAAFIFTINARYRHQSSDTVKAWHSIPLFHYEDFTDFQVHRPHDCQLIGVEIDYRARGIMNFIHPPRAIYLMGPEDGNLSAAAIEKCQTLIQLPGNYCLNVAVAGSIIMYDRLRSAE